MRIPPVGRQVLLAGMSKATMRGPCLPAFWAILAAAIVAIGCADTTLSRFNRHNPFRQDDWAAEEQFGTRPGQKVSELQVLADSGASLPPAEQTRYAQLIYAQYADEVDPQIRAAMLRAVSQLPTPEAAATLKAGQSDRDAFVRLAACESWQRRGGPEALEALATIVASDTSVDVRLAATRALGTFKDPAAIRALGVALEDNDPALQYRAMESLRLVSGKDYGGNVHAWREFAKGGNPQVPPGPSFVERLFTSPWY